MTSNISPVQSIAAINDDGYIYITYNFSAINPTWRRYLISGMSGKLLDFVPDPFSPRYLGTGEKVNGWIVTENEIGHLADVFGTSRTYTVQHTFASSVSGSQRLIETERSTQGFVVVVTYYPGIGTKAIVSTDGVTWGSETTLTSNHAGVYLSPGLVVSGKVPNTAYTAAIVSGGNFQGYKYSSGSWSAISNPDISGTRLPGWIHIPWDDNDDSLIYYGAAIPEGSVDRIYKAQGTTRTDITPFVSGIPYTCRYPRSLDTCAINRQHVVLTALNDPVGPTNRNAVFVSSNGGTSWTAVHGPVSQTTADYLGVRCSGDNEDEFYVFGPNGKVAYSNDFGITPLQNKRGNIGDYGGVGRFLNICSGQSQLSHQGPTDCPFNHAGIGSEQSLYPISLIDGEKREQVTDLSLNTPAGILAFTRAYRQSELANPDLRTMGLGWAHNHNYLLTKHPGTPNTIVVRMPSGGEFHLTETANGSNSYLGDPGSTATIAWDGTKYTLTTQDATQYVFDTPGQLTTNKWQLTSVIYPSDEIWIYTYDGTSKKLTDIDDGYGRGLQFSYINNPSQFDDEQLWRVGDHTATGLSGGSPSGRYVEFGYLQEKLDGSTTGTPNPLLTTVQDVRGNIWTYAYYGQNPGEDDSDQKNFLTEFLSPAVDTLGDGSTGSPLSLDQLEYTMDGATITEIVQQRGDGLIITDWEFQPDENLTTETTGTKTLVYRFADNVLMETEDPAGNLNVRSHDNQYRPSAQVDANGNETQLTWSSDGKRLNSVTDALEHETQFDYNLNDTLNFSVDAQRRKTEYTYDDTNNPRLPTQIDVIDADGTTLLRRQAFVYDTGGRTLEEQVLDPSDGTTLLSKTIRTYGTSGNGEGLLESLTQLDLLNPANDVSTTYTYDSAGRILKTQKSSLFGSCQVSYTVYDLAGNVVASICNYENSGAAPTTAAEAAALYDLAEPDKNHVTTYEYDPLGRRIKTVTNAGDGANAVHAQTTLTVYDALDRVVRTISNYVEDVGITTPYVAAHNAFDHGAEHNQNLVTDTAYNARGLVRQQVDVLGNVTLYGYDDADRLVKTVQNASQPSYNNDYMGTSPDPSLGSYAPNIDADQDIVTIQAYDANGNLVESRDTLGNVTYTVYDPLNRPVKVVRSAKTAATLAHNVGDPGYAAENDPRSDDYTPSADPDRDAIETTECDALGHVIRTRRLLENRPSAMWDVTLYGYDPLGRQVKVIRSASVPDYDLGDDPDLSDYSASPSSDQDVVTSTTYDALGRVFFTEDPLGIQTRPVYDGLNRQVRTIANFIDQGEDPAEWVWSSLNSRWEQSGGSAIAHGTNHDQNSITEMIYDSDGRVEATRDVLGRLIHNVYDSVGRVVRTITNYVPQGASNPANWVWNNGWKQGSGGGALVVSHGADNDQNIVADTVYDALGRVTQTVDHRHNASFSCYDVLGRRVKTITNYLAQGVSDPVDWLWSGTNQRWEDGSGNAIDFGMDNDQNRISTTRYDLAGRVTHSRDSAGVETRYAYDTLGRRTQTTTNYVDGTFNPNVPDEDLISATGYNKGGQVVSTTDARGTQTAFTYDALGRRRTVIQAAGSPLATSSYTAYDKAGRVLRTIANWSNNPLQPLPDARDGITGDWRFVPADHGLLNDHDLVTQYEYDLASRPTKVTDPLSNFTTTTYFKDGQVSASADPAGVVTVYRYDRLRRRTRVVQSFVAQTEDPALWVWNSGWKQSNGTTPIAHGANNDQNVIVDLTYDTAGRVTSQREPRGNLTSYSYDQLNRRKTLTNPLSKTWTTAYIDLTSGKSQTTMTMPGITGAANYTITRQFDRLGRSFNVAYGDAATTPDVAFSYDGAGNRAKMTETGSSSTVRETTFGYDDLHRLTSVGFDNDGSGSVDQTVSYAYDAGGLRTKLTLPGSLDITYTYDIRGQLIALTDWDDQQARFAYDNLGRHVTTERANGLRSRYQYDAGGRLRALRHAHKSKMLAQFLYEVDARGNRVQAQETVAHPASTSDVSISHDDQSLVTRGTWANVSGFKQSTEVRATLSVAFFGDAATLTMGTGPDHSLYDIYIDGSLWQSFDGYAASPDEHNILVTAGIDSRALTSEGLHILEIRNRAERQSQSSGSKVRFKQLVIADEAYDLQTITYSYDALARLKEARYAPGVNALAGDADLLRRHQYSYDLSGNRLSEAVALNGGSPTTTNYTYNAANQLTSDGTNTLTYDNNGNLTSDGVNSYTWDRANRLLSMGGSSYAYDGAGNRISQTIGVDVTQYLLDLQPGLATVLQSTQDTDTTRYIHAPRGIHSQQDASDQWTWMLQDDLGSVRSVVDNSLSVLESRLYEPYGTPFGGSGTSQTVYGFTGEPTDTNELLYLRARYYAPNLGVFTGLDPFEGFEDEPMSLNSYGYVYGNPVNWNDPSGSCPENPWWNDLPGQRCIWLAHELSQKYNIPLSVLMQKDWGELEYLYGLGNLNNTLSDASILPRIFSENPQAAIQALGQYICNNGSGNFLVGFFATVAHVGIGVLDRLPGVDTLIPAGWGRRVIQVGRTVLELISQIGGIADTAARRREIEQADETAQARDRRNPFDLAFGLSFYSGFNPLGFGDLGAFAASFTDRRTLPFYLWPDWMKRDEVGLNVIDVLDREALKRGFDLIISTYLFQIVEGKLKFNLSGMEYRSPEESITNWELERILSRFRSATNFYLFDASTATPTQLRGLELEAKLAEIRTPI